MKLPMTFLKKSTPCTEVKNDVDDAAEVGDLIVTMPEIPSLAPSGRLTSQTGDSKRHLSHLLWHNTQSSDLHHVGRMFDQYQRHIN